MDKDVEIAQLKNELRTIKYELSELQMVINAPDDFVIMSKNTYKEFLRQRKQLEELIKKEKGLV
jgi:hypothetical protein